MLKKIVNLSIPMILSQLSSVIIQYTDSTMIAKLGTEQSAAMGLIGSVMTFIRSISIVATVGFSVQISQMIGADNINKARSAVKQGLLVSFLISLVSMTAVLFLHDYIPVWVGGDDIISSMASEYLFIYAFIIPCQQMRFFSSTCLESSGNAKKVTVLNTALCILNIIFNIMFMSPDIFNLGIKGAGLATLLSEIIISGSLFLLLAFKSDKFAFKLGGSFRFDKDITRYALRVSLPAIFGCIMIKGAYIFTTVIIAPLGTTAIAANSLAFTVESMCNVFGDGLASVATIITGELIGAGDKKRINTGVRMMIFIGIFTSVIMASVMFLSAPSVFAFLTDDIAVQELGVSVLKIQALAEPLFFVALILTGVFNGAGDTVYSNSVNLLSIWFIRIIGMELLVGTYGLAGMWIAAAAESSVRGIVHLIHASRGKWMKNRIKC